MRVRRIVIGRKRYRLYGAPQRVTAKKRNWLSLLPGLRPCSNIVAILSVATTCMLCVHAGNAQNVREPDGRKYVGVSSRPINAESATSVGDVTKIPAEIPAAPAKSQSQVLGASVSAGGPPAWASLPFYVDPTNEATAYAQANPGASGASLIAREGTVPVANWIGDWTTNVQATTNAYVAAASQANATPVLVLYAIPERDCGGYSYGGLGSTAAYVSWVRSVAAGVGSRSAIIILEPDALASLDCLSSADQQSRYSALAQAVTILKANPNSSVYLDAGNPAWQTVSTMALRLKAANIAQADGFSLNVSNYVSTAVNQSYGDQLSKLVGNKHYVIDTSRNGNGAIAPDDWCNAPAGALGSKPTTITGDPRNDALLWVKLPWESDGTCNGGPTAGLVYWSFAVQLAQNAGW